MNTAIFCAAVTSSTSYAQPMNDLESVKPLSLAHLPRAITTLKEAFRDDPTVRYIYDTPDAHFNGPPLPFVLSNSLMIANAIRRHEAFSIDHGNAFVTFQSAPEELTPPQKWIERLFFSIIKAISNMIRILTGTKEQRVRFQEYRQKSEAAMVAHLKDRFDALMVIGDIATSPRKQGHGYGTQLLQSVMAIADKRGRAIWLTSSNTANLPFYESNGFKTLGDIVLGDDNPTFDSPPVVISLMVREPVREDASEKVLPPV